MTDPAISSLHIIGSMTGGGAENFYLRLVAAMHAQGLPVHAVVRPGSVVAHELDPGVPRTPVAMANAFDIFSRRRISRLAAQLRPAIVQTYMGKATRLTHLAPRSGALHVARLGNYYALHSYRHCDAWIGNTKGICDYMRRAGFPAERVRLIYNFIDQPPPVSGAALDEIRQRHAIAPDAWVLLAAGRFAPIKGFDDLLRACARLPATIAGRPLCLVILGDGDLRETLHTQARQLGIESRVRWAGWQTNMHSYYALADLVVFPAHEQEPFGNVLLETWAHGKPLLATRYLGALELTTHGADAWLTPCEDATALADAIRTLLSDDGLRATLGAAGLARAQRDFSRQAVVGNYLETYAELLSLGPRPRRRWWR